MTQQGEDPLWKESQEDNLDHYCIVQDARKIMDDIHRRYNPYWERTLLENVSRAYVALYDRLALERTRTSGRL